VAVAAQGRDAPSMEWVAMFGSFNERFEGRTPFDWLSRDPAEVDKYVADPWSGSFRVQQRARPRLLHRMNEAWLPEHEARIPGPLRWLIISGDQDPGRRLWRGDAGVPPSSALWYRALGLADLSREVSTPVRRHEVLKRDEPRRGPGRHWPAWLDGAGPGA